MQLISWNQLPDLLTVPTSLAKMSGVLHLPHEMHLCRSASNVIAWHQFCKRYKALAFCSFLARCRIHCACQENDDSTSTSGPQMRWFEHSFFDMWLRQRALFPQVNFQKCLQRCATFDLSYDQMASHPPLLRAYFSTLLGHKTLDNTVFRDFSTFLSACILFIMTLWFL